MTLHILPPESTTVQSSDLVWLLSYASSIKEEEEEEEEEGEEEDDEQCGKLHRLIKHLYQPCN